MPTGSYDGCLSCHRTAARSAAISGLLFIHMFRIGICLTRTWGQGHVAEGGDTYLGAGTRTWHSDAGPAGRTLSSQAGSPYVAGRARLAHYGQAGRAGFALHGNTEPTSAARACPHTDQLQVQPIARTGPH